MTQTSATSPLPIRELTARFGPTPGTIGMTVLPGASGGSEKRDFAADLDAVRAWRPKLVLSLLQDGEYAQLGEPTFKRDAVATGLPWLFVEIAPGGVPDVVFERGWISLGTRMRTYLAEGGRVLVHCRAGLGRSGIVAAMLLVESGVDADTAIANVREVEPRAIESPAQEAYVRAHTLAKTG